MRKLTMVFALCSTALATPAIAQDGKAYIEAGFGPMIAEDIDITELDPPTGNQATLEPENFGFDGGVVIGYDFGGFRLEAEASYRKTDFEQVVTPLATIAQPTLDADISALSFMGNVLADFGSDDGLQFFFGVGGGAAKLKSDVAVGGIDFVQGSDWEFAWQGIAGVRAPLSDNLDVGLRYRYFHVDDFQIGGDNGTSVVGGDWTSHSLLGTLTYNFGGAKAAPAPAPVVRPVAPPPPPPPQPVQAPAPMCETGPYIVFFNWDESTITPEAATILDNAVSAYANCGAASVMLAGHTDTSGSTSYNMGLAERRNASVRGYLNSRGISDSRISAEAFGESQLRVPTADGVRELQNRRVEITYGPGSGM